jgi:hypothetical protein
VSGVLEKAKAIVTMICHMVVVRRMAMLDPEFG